MQKHYSTGTDLDIALKFVMEAPDDFHHRKRFHSVFLRTKFYTPTLKESPIESEPFFPLRIYENNQTFFITFDSQNKYEQWLDLSKAPSDEIKIVEIFGQELIECLGPTVHLCLNPADKSYYEMNPQQIQFLKKAVEKTKNPNEKNDL